MEEGHLTGSLVQNTEPAGHLNISGELDGPIELLTSAWAVTRSRFWALLGSILIPMAAISILIPIFWVPALAGIFSAVVTEKNVMEYISAGMVGGFVLTVIVMALAAGWQTVAMIEIIAGADEGVSLWAALGKAFRKVPGFLALGIISGLITVGAYIPLLIPAVVVAVWFSFGIYVYVTEGVGGLKALRISREYCRNRFLPVFGRQLIIILIYGLWFGIQAVVGAVLGKELFAKVEWLFVLAGIPLWILIPVYQYMIYKNLKQVRGRIDPAEVEAGKTKWILLAVWGVASSMLLPILSFILLAKMINPVQKFSDARDAQTRIGMQVLERYVSEYQAIEGKYPASLENLVPDVVNQLPQGEYQYRQMDGGRDFELCAVYEDGDRDCIQAESNNDFGEWVE